MEQSRQDRSESRDSSLLPPWPQPSTKGSMRRRGESLICAASPSRQGSECGAPEDFGDRYARSGYVL